MVEVRASGLLNGHLQFPSIAGIRTDKYVDDIDTVDDVKQFDEVGVGFWTHWFFIDFLYASNY